MIRWLAALVLVALAAPLAAQQAPSAAVTLRAGTLMALFRDTKVDESTFAPTFLAQVSGAQIEVLAKQLRESNGAVGGLEKVTPESATQAVVQINYAKALVTARIALEPDAPHRFIGLLITGVQRRDDNFDAVVRDMKALPGTTSLLVTKIGAAPMVDHNAAVPMATGSTFKLFVLAELARAVDAKERRWSDVVPLGPPSLPSGVTQGWPKGLPVTLGTLATQMISISDNTAADTLIAALGRPKIDAMRASVGDTPGALPVLSTVDAFVLKMPSKTGLRQRWIDGGLSERRQVLNELEPVVGDVDAALLATAPLYLDTVEWPATMGEIAKVFDRLRAANDATALDILSVNTALTPNERARFAYVGYKGGSENGVVALSWLLGTPEGQWFVVAGAWNNAAASVDTAKFAILMQRAVALVGRRSAQ